MKSRSITVRTGAFFAGLVTNAFGISLITKAGLGTSPISSVPYVLSLGLPQFSFGMWTFLLNMLFIILQVILLKKRFRLVQLLQIPVNFLFSALIDIAMGILSWIQPTSFPLQLAVLLAGCILLGYGVSLEVAPDLVMVPGEGIVDAIVKVSGQPFGLVKNLLDLSLMVTAGLLSLIFFGGFSGIGPGTLISAVLIGRVVAFSNRYSQLVRFVKNAGHEAEAQLNPEV